MKINRFPGSAQERQLRDDIFGANAQLNNIWAKSSRHNQTMTYQETLITIGQRIKSLTNDSLSKRKRRFRV